MGPRVRTPAIHLGRRAGAGRRAGDHLARVLANGGRGQERPGGCQHSRHERRGGLPGKEPGHGPAPGTDPAATSGISETAMYERFTDRARKVIQLANQEAQRFNHAYIGTETILLGLVKEGSGIAVNVLKNLDIDLRKIRLEVEKIVQSGPDM